MKRQSFTLFVTAIMSILLVACDKFNSPVVPPPPLPTKTEITSVIITPDDGSVIKPICLTLAHGTDPDCPIVILDGTLDSSLTSTQEHPYMLFACFSTTQLFIDGVGCSGANITHSGDKVLKPSIPRGGVHYVIAFIVLFDKYKGLSRYERPDGYLDIPPDALGAVKITPWTFRLPA